ncbi:MAG: DUF3102 domain-containing protein, partial [Verrucomicrobiota bacterium]
MKKPTEEYWVWFVESKNSQKMSGAEISALLIPEGPSLMLMKSDNTGGWQAPSYFGFRSQSGQRNLKRKKTILPAPEPATNSPCDAGQLVISEPVSPDKHDHESVSAVCGKSYESMPLSDLGPAIAKLHEGAEQCSASARKVVENALAFVLEAGKALQAAKDKVHHGEWGSWLRQHVPALSHDRANRYMKAAREIPHVRNLDKIKTVRQLYISTGVVKEPAKGSAKKSTAPALDRDTALAPADFVSRFRALRGFLEHAKPRLLAGEMPLAEVTEMAGE